MSLVGWASPFHEAADQHPWLACTRASSRLYYQADGRSHQKHASLRQKLLAPNHTYAGLTPACMNKAGMHEALAKNCS